MSVSRSVIKNIFFRWGQYGISAVVSFVMLPFLLHKLGDSIYGLWILIGSFTGYLGLLDMGIGMSLVKYISEFTAKKDHKSLGRFIASSFFLYSFIGFYLSAHCGYFYYSFPQIFQCHRYIYYDRTDCYFYSRITNRFGIPIRNLWRSIKGP